jgi:hypothetical protein
MKKFLNWMLASIAEDGTITLTKAKMHPEDSGIEW